MDGAGAQGCDVQTVSVTDLADLALSRDGAAVVPADRRALTYALTVENRPPSAGGMVASGVVLEETLAPGASYQTVDANGPFICTAGGRTLQCSIGDLAVGGSAQAIITVALDGGLEPGAEVAAQSSVRGSAPDAIPDNNELLVNLALLPAADFMVTSLADGGDINPGDGVCASTDGCTLRAAVEEANALPGAQTVAMGYGVHQLNIQDEGGRLRAGSDPLVVRDDLTITGLSPDRTIVNANGLSRVFHAEGAALTLRDLMLSGGAVSGDDGGAVLVVNGELSLERVALAGNSARNGGGVMAHESTVTIRQSAITDNRAQADGGQGGSGVYLRGGTLTVQNSTFSGNQVGQGGAMTSDSGTVTLQNVTLIGNGANVEGGGVHSPNGGVSAVNTILAGNGAPLGTNCLGRIASEGYNLLGDLDSCTITGNTGSNALASGAEWAGLTRTFADTYAYPLTPDS